MGRIVFLKKYGIINTEGDYMLENIFVALIGAVIIVIGFINRTGNISLLHSYHRKNVSEEDKLPLGKKVGLSMIIVGISIILLSVFGILTFLLGEDIYYIIGTIISIIGITIGTIIALIAIKKYNKTIF